MPIKSTQMALPSITENPSNAHGKYGAKKLRIPKKFIRMYGFRRDQTYTNIMVNAWPRNNKFTKNANIWKLKQFHVLIETIMEHYVWCTHTHQCTAEEEHHDEIRTLSTEWTLLQHTTISICERHIEQKIESYRAEE